MEQRRLYHVQNLAFEIMDEMNAGGELERRVDLKHVVDHLSRAIGSLADPSGTFSLDYVEERIAAAHYSVFKNEKKLSCLKIKSPAVK
ncbi:hypothetical protein AS034_19645 [[Bacillus] enclensis]|uniref:Uncharacterized protein n=2 Tax=[Bacillus] enclensis TaxID=1402860 RepID=A0A0V8H8N5_9BACI|nr:hypothetical protein [[Bacillus] enclensis]OAT80606.1 hypothetical protein A6P54_14580 [Bacillus sp. MKU004]QWC22232.1 hypothetical protein KJK41_18495 [Bacillus haikouensis]KSU58719.1 hypothetical protein AS034_19645 [[Bacillus] enclensis]MBH9965820.1 hypothetical protein [[Bacillus] enclensis]SCC33529.1 hypothetical protein GA0061094_4069 [[Bacillus] enclensis]